MSYYEVKRYFLQHRDGKHSMPTMDKLNASVLGNSDRSPSDRPNSGTFATQTAMTQIDFDTMTDSELRAYVFAH